MSVDVINNAAAADQYTQALTLGPNYQADGVTITVANNPALMQFAVGYPGNWRWADEREWQVAANQSFRVNRVIGVRFRNAVAGAVARIIATLAGPDDPDFGTGLFFTGTLNPNGTITPAANPVNIQHNGLQVGSEPTLDFEDVTGWAWTVADDAANTRIKVTPPRQPVVAGVINSDGTIAAGSGFTTVRNGVGNYTITIVGLSGNAACVVTPAANANISTVAIVGAGSVNVITTIASTGATSDQKFHFAAFNT